MATRMNRKARMNRKSRKVNRKTRMNRKSRKARMSRRFFGGFFQMGRTPNVQNAETQFDLGANKPGATGPALATPAQAPTPANRLSTVNTQTLSE